MSPVREDKDLRTIIGFALRIGVILATGVLVIGAILFYLQHHGEAPHFKNFSGEPHRFTNLKEILSDALRGKGRSVIQLGLLLLILTPVARVVLAIVGFAFERDKLYLVVGAIVLMATLFSLFG